MTITLRPHQETAITQLRQAIKSGDKRIVLMAACAFGKTLTAAYMCKSAAEKGRRTIFIADRIELIDQTSRAFDAMGIRHGIIRSGDPRVNPHALVQIASVQTLAAKRVAKKRLDAVLAGSGTPSAALLAKGTMPRFEVAIIDEMHCVFEEHKALMSENPDSVFIGLSATPWTKGLGKMYQSVVHPISVSELIAGGYLIEPEVYGTDEPDLSEVRIVAGEYKDDDLAAAVSKPRIITGIVDQWFEYCKNEPTICFAVNVNHSKLIVQAFQNRGIKAEHIDGYEPDVAERKAKIERFRSGETVLLSSVDILSKGFDYPGARCAILARPTKSKMLFIQQLGRIMRTCEGKTYAKILDHAGNHARHGFVTDPMDTKLCDGKKSKSVVKKKEKEEPLAKRCPKCSYLKPAAVHKCPACGFSPIGPSRVLEVEGELKLISRKQQKVPKSERFGTKQEVYSMLLSLCKHDKVAAHRYRQIFNVWPKGLSTARLPPSHALANWHRAQNIAYAKSQQKANPPSVAAANEVPPWETQA